MAAAIVGKSSLKKAKDHEFQAQLFEDDGSIQKALDEYRNALHFFEKHIQSLTSVPPSIVRENFIIRDKISALQQRCLKFQSKSSERIELRCSKVSHNSDNSSLDIHDVPVVSNSETAKSIVEKALTSFSENEHNSTETKHETEPQLQSHNEKNKEKNYQIDNIAKNINGILYTKQTCPEFCDRRKSSNNAIENNKDNSLQIPPNKQIRSRTLRRTMASLNSQQETLIQMKAQRINKQNSDLNTWVIVDKEKSKQSSDGFVFLDINKEQSVASLGLSSSVPKHDPDVSLLLSCDALVGEFNSLGKIEQHSFSVTRYDALTLSLLPNIPSLSLDFILDDNYLASIPKQDLITANQTINGKTGTFYVEISLPREEYHKPNEALLFRVVLCNLSNTSVLPISFFTKQSCNRHQLNNISSTFHGVLPMGRGYFADSIAYFLPGDINLSPSVQTQVHTRISFSQQVSTTKNINFSFPIILQV